MSPIVKFLDSICSAEGARVSCRLMVAASYISAGNFGILLASGFLPNIVSNILIIKL
jgi:hypothetical protein